MSMVDDYLHYMYKHPFELGAFVELTRAPGAIFEVMEHCRDYDGTAFVRLKFVGPRRGIPPRTIGRLHKHFRIKQRYSSTWSLVEANPMMVVAIMGS